MAADLLENIPLFANLSADAREQLALLFRRRTVAAHEPIFWIGESGQEMFIVQEGRVRLSYPDDAGVDVTVATLGPGAFFGEISLLDGSTRTATARAETGAVLLSLDRAGFDAFLLKHPSAAIHMVSVLSQRLRQSMDRLRGIRNVNEEVEKQQTPLQGIVDKAAEIGASGIFLICNIVFIVIWIIVQSVHHNVPVNFHDEPPTFFWLGFMITLEAILLTMFVLSSQRRQAERDRIQADLDYQVNLKAHVEVMELHRKVDRLVELLEERPKPEAGPTKARP